MMKRMVFFTAAPILLYAPALPPSEARGTGRVETDIAMKQRRVGANVGYAF